MTFRKKLLWKLRLLAFKVKFQFKLGWGEILQVGDKDRRIGKSTYLVNVCRKHNYGLIVGTLSQRRLLQQNTGYRHIYCETDLKRYTTGHVREFITDETVSYKFLSENYVNDFKRKYNIIGGIIYAPKHSK